ncbi:MAG: hypothetical protein QXJ53_03060 [Candidatus Bathyarchaeia archaeon]
MNRALLNSLVFLMLGFSMLLGGFCSGDAVLATLGAALGFACLSSALTLYVTSEGMLKRVTVVASAFVALGIIVGGYILTESAILGIITILIAFLIFIAFMLSYICPKFKAKGEQLKFKVFRRESR